MQFCNLRTLEAKKGMVTCGISNCCTLELSGRQWVTRGNDQDSEGVEHEDREGRTKTNGGL